MDNTYKLSLKNISKSFPGVKALQDFSLDVRPGTVHAIVGENGAGKSTLMKIINGTYHPDEGEIFIDGKKVVMTDPSVSVKHGIAMIFQELNFMPEMTVAEHLYMMREPQNFRGVVNWKELYKKAQEILTEEELPYNPKEQMKDLSVSDIQLVEIARALSQGADIIIMDEPTASISEFEVRQLFKKINKLREKGVTILYISHKLDEIFEIADYVTVVRDGVLIETRPTKEFDEATIVHAMVGRKIDDIYPARSATPGEVVMEVSHLSQPGVFEDISFNVRKGEILGFAGLVGAGRTEILSAVAGLTVPKGGEIRVENEPVKVRSVESAMKHGILMATEDRKKYGFVGIRNIQENISLPNADKISRFGVIQPKKEEEVTRRMFDALQIKAPSLKTLTYSLSGGNQQKVVLAKWLLHDPEILILDEPTRGIDVGAKHEIYKIMDDLTTRGIPIIMVSSELPEIIGMCDRVYVISERSIVAEYTGDDITQENIMKVQTGGRKDHAN